MSETRRPVPPDGLAEHGRRLWLAILSEVGAGFELDARELDCLSRACAIADRIGELEAAVDADGVMVDGSTGQKRLHPAIAEIRGCELARLRLLSAIELVDDQASGAAATPAQARARAAANARWARRDRVRATRHA